MRKKIALWLTALLLSASIFSGCTDEDVQLVGDLLELVLDASETTAAQTETETEVSWAEDGTDSGAISDFGDMFQGKTEAETTIADKQETEASTEAAAKDQESTKAQETTKADAQTSGSKETEVQTQPEEQISEDGEYLSVEDVALYIATYGHLPSNYMTKDEAEALGWSSREGNLWEVAPGACIGGDRFGNYEGILPKKSGRKYTECDVNYDGGYRSSERIVFSNDGLVYYTADHYETFTLLYGEE